MISFLVLILYYSNIYRYHLIPAGPGYVEGESVQGFTRRSDKCCAEINREGTEW